jgi:hypothetical protein
MNPKRGFLFFQTSKLQEIALRELERVQISRKWIHVDSATKSSLKKRRGFAR